MMLVMSRLLLASLLVTTTVGLTASQNQTALRTELLSGYDLNVQPTGTTVRVQLALQNIVNVDTPEQTVTISSWWRLSWTDERLVWDPADYGGISFLTFIGSGETKELWAPDIMVYEAVEVMYATDPRVFWVYSDGSVGVSMPMTHKILCPMNLDDFPNDVQTCSFTYGSWSFNGDVYNLGPKLSGSDANAIDLATFRKNSEFSLLKVACDYQIVYYNCCPEPYPILTYSLTLHRQAFMYLNGIAIPLIVTTYCALFTFLLNPDSGERIGLAVTLMLTNAAIFIVASDVMPKIGTWTTISVLYTVSFSYTVFTLLVAVFAASMHNIKDSTGCLTEQNLLQKYIDADVDVDGSLDANELQHLVEMLGFSECKIEKFRALMKARGLTRVTFPDWYDLVGELHEADGLAAFHNWLAYAILLYFVPFERKRRKEFVLRRYETISDKKPRRGKTHAAKRSLSLKAASFFKKNPTSPSNRVQPEADSTQDNATPTSAVPAPLNSEIDSTVQKVLEIQDFGDDENDMKGMVEGRERKDVPIAPSNSTSEKKNAPKDLVTDYELSDPTTLVARRVVAWLDWFMFLALSISYSVIISIQLGAALDRTEFIETEIEHTSS